jgi:hypothetical protein
VGSPDSCRGKGMARSLAGDGSDLVVVLSIVTQSVSSRQQLLGLMARMLALVLAALCMLFGAHAQDTVCHPTADEVRSGRDNSSRAGAASSPWDTRMRPHPRVGLLVARS